MLKYLIFITIGILLYLLLNRYNTFSIGAILRIPLGTSLVVNQIDFTNSENVPHTPRIGGYTYQPINQIYWANGQYYYYTDINMHEIMYGDYDQTLIDNINNNIQTAPTLTPTPTPTPAPAPDTERERHERQEREEREEREER